MTDRIERVLFADRAEDTDEMFRILDDGGELALLDYCTEWHQPGNHETSDDHGHGAADETVTRDGYTLAYNRGLEYVSLEFDTESPANYPTNFDRFDICEAWYLALSHCHGGQGSTEYARLCKLTRAGFFQPSPMLSVESLNENARAIYHRACESMNCNPE